MFNPITFTTSQWLLVPLVIFGRYALVCSLMYILFYLWKRKAWFKRKIQSKFPHNRDYVREIGYSATTSIIFAFVSWLTLGTSFRQYTQFYTDIHQYGILYLVLSIPLTLLIHDTYFYWIHRLLHLPWWYKKFHRTHHTSTNPSPWAAYAFHPVEAVFEAGIAPLLLLIMPLHPISFLGFVTLMIWFNVYGHLGYEVFPRSVYTHPVGRWLNSGVYHNQHHERFHGNYSLYFVFWDRWMGTLRPDSAEKLDMLHRQIETDI